MKDINKLERNEKSVKSINPFKSVIQTIYDIVKAHGGELEGARLSFSFLFHKLIIR
jgi:hypothetical protein